MPAGSTLNLPDGYEECGFYVVEGRVGVDEQILDSGALAVARAGKAVRIVAQTESHVMVIGGSSPGPRHIWWNFVSSSRERIERAKADWREQRFDPVPGETEFIPLPD